MAKCSFAWERGSKVFVTEAEAVNPNTRACFWKQYLRQVSAAVHGPGSRMCHDCYGRGGACGCPP